METVTLERRDGELRITLNRPDALNAWNKQLGADLLAAVREAAADDGVRAVVITGAGRAFSSGADLRAGFDPTPEGHPDVETVLHERLPPDHRRPARAAQAGGGGGQRAGGGDRLLAGAGLRPDRGARVGLLPARLREHRPGARRRLVAAAAGAGRPRACDGDGDARRADRCEAGARMGPDQPRDRRRRARRAWSTSWRPAWRPARRAAYAGIKRQFNAWLFTRMAEQLDLEASIQQQSAASGDFAEGVQAFLEKRPAAFSGR